MVSGRFSAIKRQVMPRKKLLGKKNGKSIRQTYTTQNKEQACITYWVTGTVKGAAKEIGMPRETLRTWMGTEWWADMTHTVREAVDDKLEVELVKTLELSMSRVQDSLTKGDEKLVWNPVTKKHVRERVKPTGLQAATMYGISSDKYRLGRNLPNTITDQGGGQDLLDLMVKFQNLSKQHDAEMIKKVNSIKGELDDN